ncbi:hypothetical protein JCM5350_006607 [Sporobolomyces pararoseus]
MRLQGEQVQGKIMRKTYSEGNTFYLKEGSETRVLLLGEQSVSDLYFQGILVARAHRDIKNVLFKDGAPLIFEGYWTKQFPQEAREHYVLDALDETSKVIVGQGRYIRRLCPDLTVSKLAQDDSGMGLINLVRFICRSPSTFSQQEDYFAVPCQAFDDYFEINENQDSSLPTSRAKRIFQTAQKHDRNWFISRFVLTILKYMEQVTEEFIPSTLVEKERKPLTLCEQHFIRGGSVASGDICSELEREACASCRRYPEEIPGYSKEKLFHCKTCLQIDPPYKVAYCSKDCQKIDWEKGGHQDRCGRRISDLAFPPFGWQHPPDTPLLPLTLQSLHRHPEKCFYIYSAKRSPYGEGSHRSLFGDGNGAIFKRKGRFMEVGFALDKAIDSGTEEDLRAFVGKLTTSLASSDQFKSQILPQVVADWSVEPEKVRQWMEEALEEMDNFEGDIERMESMV